LSDFTKSVLSNLESDISDGLASLGIQANGAQIVQTVKYLSLLLKWNKSFNLVSTLDINEILRRHFLDSLSINTYLSGRNIIDVGSGAGFPGIPLAVFNPDKQFTLIDSNGKKTRFLFQARMTLDLPLIEIKNCRIEHYQTERQIDMVVSRAVSNLADLVVKLRHLVSKESRILVMKGIVPKNEIKSLPDDFEVVNIEKLDLSNTNLVRHVIEISPK
tara:strand:- start:1468 stop:2118 length:651 start_codon:yes stop_codon:yes gene_type:complete